jgi:hypothetical protein
VCKTKATTTKYPRWMQLQQVRRRAESQHSVLLGAVWVQLGGSVWHQRVSSAAWDAGERGRCRGAY